MSREVPSLPLQLPGAAPESELDPELLAMPGPPRQKRTLTIVVLALAAVAALGMVYALRYDVAYALVGSTEANVGELRTASGDTLVAHENRLIRAEGMLGAAGGIRYERLLSDDTFRAVPVAGRRDVWVEMRVPAGQESGRWQPPREFSGRLIRFDTAGPRHSGLAGAIERVTHEPVPRGAWLLVDGEAPAYERWVLVVAATFMAFAIWHVAAIARMLREVR